MVDDARPRGFGHPRKLGGSSHCRCERHYDRVICLGDIVDYGPSPVEAVSWVQDNADLVVRGNHDTAVALGVGCRSAPAFRRLAEETRQLTIPMLSQHHREYLANLPVRLTTQFNGLRVEVLHAAPEDPLYQYLPASDLVRWHRAVEQVDADVILVGHTHMPVVFEVGDKLVVNPGSVGLQRDGDPRASYAVFENGRPMLRRVPYAVEITVGATRAWGLPRDVADALAHVYETGSLPA